MGVAWVHGFSNFLRLLAFHGSLPFSKTYEYVQYVFRHWTLIFATLLNLYVQCGVSVTLVCSTRHENLSKIDVHWLPTV